MGWTRHSSKTVFENNWFRVLEDEVTNPGGGQNLYGHVQFKNRAVAILPVDDHGNTWLVGQERYTLGEYSWELPMGGAPEGESLLECAKRELREETGLSAKNWQETLQLHTSNSVTDEVGVVYIATGLSQGETEFEETEDLRNRKLPLEEAVEMVLNGDISDAISVAALLHYTVSRT